MNFTRAVYLSNIVIERKYETITDKYPNVCANVFEMAVIEKSCIRTRYNILTLTLFSLKNKALLLPYLFKKLTCCPCIFSSKHV